MGQQTKGPWITDSSCIIRASTGEEIGRCMSQRYEVAEANARLMAASPDLLEALESAVRYGDLMLEVETVARAAITKAKGTRNGKAEQGQ